MTPVLRLVVRLAAVTLAVSAADLVVSGPAQASTCSTAKGVSVVVDFHQLGGGAQSFCDAGGAGKYAAAQFADAGHELTYVQNEPFVCQVDGAPDRQCPRTPPADAYWSLWWSDGKSGQWKYASVGVISLKVPEGGYVALSWQGQSSQAEPRVTPTAHAVDGPSASPSASPSTRPPTPSPHASTGTGQAPPSATASRSSSPAAPTTSASAHTGGHTAKHHSTPPKAGKGHGHASHAPDQTEAAQPLGQVAGKSAAVADSSGSGGLPGWVAPVAIGVLFAGAGTIALMRRKTGGG